MALQTRLGDMVIGDKIVARFHSGGTGTILDLGTAEADPIVPANGLPPGGAVGKFYFIYVGNDFRGRRLLVADRNVMNSISWDDLNKAGYATQNGIEKDIGADPALWKTNIRLLRGGTSSATTVSSEWDKYIVNGHAPGDNTVWNWQVGTRSWTSSSSSTNSNRVLRGFIGTSDVGAWSALASSTTNSNTGFRPVLVAESLTEPIPPNLFLIEDGEEVKKHDGSSWVVVGTAPATEEMLTTNGMTDLSMIPTEAWNQLGGMFSILEYIDQVEDMVSGLKVEYEDKGQITRTAKLTAIPKSRTILPIGDISVGENIETIVLNTTPTSSGHLKIIVSGDSGATYQGKAAVDITDLSSVKANGFTPEELNALTKEQLAVLFPEGKARFAFYLEQENVSDVVEIQSLSVGEKVYTVSPTIEDISIIYDMMEGEKPKLYASRDDGVTWSEVSEDMVKSLTDQPEGNKIRVKIVLKDGQEAQAVAYSWA